MKDFLHHRNYAGDTFAGSPRPYGGAGGPGGGGISGVGIAEQNAASSPYGMMYANPNMPQHSSVVPTSGQNDFFGRTQTGKAAITQCHTQKKIQEFNKKYLSRHHFFCIIHVFCLYVIVLFFFMHIPLYIYHFSVQFHFTTTFLSVSFIES